MITLREFYPASFLWICSSLSNADRLQIGLANKDFYQLLKPLFDALAHYANCQKDILRLAEKHPACQALIKLGFSTPCAKKNKNLTLILEKAIIWKDYNEVQLSNEYNPSFVSDYTSEYIESKFICSQLKTETIEAAIRIAASQKPATISIESFKLLCRQVKDINKQSSNGNTALHWALKAGNECFVYILLEKGADCKTPNRRGETPLHFAALLDTDNLVLALLRRKAYMGQDKRGNTPLDWAVCKKKTACIQALKATEPKKPIQIT